MKYKYKTIRRKKHYWHMEVGDKTHFISQGNRKWVVISIKKDRGWRIIRLRTLNKM